MMRNILIAILLVLTTTAWAVTYEPYVNYMQTPVPKSTQVHYDMPDFRFYSTSIHQSNHGYGTSRIAQHGEVREIATHEKLGLERPHRRVDADFKILGEQRERKVMTPDMWILDEVRMRSTSAMIHSDPSRRQDPTLSNTHVPMAKAPGAPGTPDAGDPGNQQPLGDAMLPLLLMALAYGVARRVRIGT